MPHPLHNFKINGTMNFYSLLTSFKNYLNTKGIVVLCLLFSLQISVFGQSFVFVNNDTIDIPISANANSATFSGGQAYIALNSGTGTVIMYRNINSADSTQVDTTFIENSARSLFVISCGDESTFIGDPMRAPNYGRDTFPDTIANLSAIEFFAFFDDTPISDSLKQGADNPIGLVSNVGIAPPTGTGSSVIAVFRAKDEISPTFTLPTDAVVDCKADTSITALGMITNVMDDCSGVRDTIFNDMITSTTILADTVRRIDRIWQVFDNQGNMRADTQKIIIIDTIPPIWDTVQVSGTALPNTVLSWNGTDTLRVVLDTNGMTSYTHFWLEQFEPAAIDSCLGIADTLLATSVNRITPVSADTMRMCQTIPGQTHSAALKITRRFSAADVVGNMIEQDGAVIDSNFVLEVYFLDTIPPAIIDTPFQNMQANMFRDGAVVDTFIVYTDTDTCGTEIVAGRMDIVVRDTFWKDSVRYNWRVTNIAGMSPATLSSPGFPGTFNKNFNDAAQFYPSGMNEITYFYQDSCMNRDSFQFVLEVRDTQPPQVVRDTFSNVFFYNAVNPQNCDQEFTFQQPDTTAAFIDDNCGVTTANITITRVIDANSDQDVIRNSNQDTIFDVSDYGTNITIDFPIDTTIFYYIYEDLQGNKDSITYTFIVLDTVPPVVNCGPSLPDLVVSGTSCTGNLPDYTNMGFVTATDCSTVTITQNPSAGTTIVNDTTITFIATDASGNQDSCSLPLRVSGVQLPTLSALTTQCDDTTIVAENVIFNCTDTVALFPINLAVPANGTTPESYTFLRPTNTNRIDIRWAVTDPNGLVTQIISQQLTFAADTVAPDVQAFRDTVTLYLDTMGMVQVSPMSLDSASTDNCTPVDSLMRTTDITSIPCDSINKRFPIRLFVADKSMNRDSQDVIVRVLDSLGPIFLDVPNDTIWACDNPLPPQPMLSILENCGTIDTMYMDTLNMRDTVGLREDTLVGFHNYDLVYKWFAMDSNGNLDSAAWTVSVRDTLPPNIPYPDTLFVSTTPDDRECTTTVTIDLSSIQDNCYDTLKFVGLVNPNGSTAISIQDTNMVNLTVRMGMDTTILIRAQDFGQSPYDTITKPVTIVVDDRTPPRPSCLDVSLTINPLGFVVVDETDINLMSTDNCTPISSLRFSLSRDTFRCEDVGQTFDVVMTVTDTSGNFAGCSSQVTIQDFVGSGVFNCPNDTAIACGTSISPDLLGFPSVIDVCTDENTLSFADDTISAVGNACITIQRTWTSRDTFGNPTNCIQLISILDTIMPSLATTFADVTVSCVGDAATADSIMVTDNCAPTYFAVAKDTAFCNNDVLTYTRIWEATDGCNIVADTQIITINDNIAPTITVPSDTFTFRTSDFIPDSCGVPVVLDFAQFVTDCNETLGLTVRHSDPANDTTSILSRYFEVGLHTITITASDLCGNMSTRNVILNIEDTSTPTVVCVENLVVSLGTGGTGALSVNNVLAVNGFIDNCGGIGTVDTVFLSQSVFDCSDLGLNLVTLTAIDSAGNAGTCTVNVDVLNQGGTDFISVTTASEPESIAGANDGRAWVTVTGGSGTSTVQWDDPNNSTTDTISNLAPGLYTVTVNDPVTGCRLTDTVRVEVGTTVNYEVCDQSGAPGTIVQVPIKVTNFNQIASVDLAFDIADPNIAQFVPINPAGGFNITEDTSSFTFIANDRLLFAGNFDPINGITLPDGTAIFFINVQLSNTVSGSTTISISGNTSSDIETGALINGSPVIIGSSSTTGTVTIGSPPAPNIFGGLVRLENGIPLENVTVNLTGDVIDSDQTDANGIYGFTVTPGQNAVVRPVETDNARNGLSVSDLVAIQSHILRQDTLDSPYTLLAADVNRTGSISISDLVDIQSLILSQTSVFPNVNSWIFVPEDFVFTNPMQPWLDTIPDSIAVASANANFIAIKMGDAFPTATTVGFTGIESEANARSIFKFGIADRQLIAGEVIEVAFKANNFEDMLGYQMTLNANPAWLSFEDAKKGVLDINDGNFGLQRVENGLISTLWYQSNPLSVEQDATLFTLTFRVEQGGKNLSEVLSVSSDMVAAQAHGSDATVENIGLAFEEVAIAERFELFQNQPNPFRTQTVIDFNLPKASTATLRFFDFSGRMVHQVKGSYPAGRNQEVIRKADLSSAGILYYELETSTHTARRKMIVIE